MRYHNITKDDMRNGDGLRVVLWVSGCSHCCAGCHNQVSWDPAGGLLFDEAAKTEVVDQLSQSYISGLTITGGDPLHAANRLEIREYLADIKELFPDKSIWLYTGDLWEHILKEPMLQNVDVLIDGGFDESKKDVRLKWKGSANQRVIDVQKTFMQAEPEVPVLYCGNYDD